jgi:peptide-methionine (S)-S-oxide reductase
MEKATFGAGCFWHVEDTFRNTPGVISTIAGYMGGTLKNPSYEDIYTGATGHAEVVQVTFDPTAISYQELLKIFWEMHDPTTLNRQGPDHGTQYRSAIFYHTLEQKTAAEKSKKNLEQTQRYPQKIVTEIQKTMTFYPAEEYHQQYFAKHGLTSCHL